MNSSNFIIIFLSFLFSCCYQTKNKEIKDIAQYKDSLYEKILAKYFNDENINDAAIEILKIEKEFTPDISFFSFDTCKCRKGIAEAIYDSKKGKLATFISTGTPDNYSNTYSRILLDSFNIGIKKIDITEDSEEKKMCYNLYMGYSIKKKYGKNIFEKIAKKTDSLYKVGLGDKAAEYRGGISAMHKFIYTNLNFFDIKNRDKKPTVHLRFTVDTSGNLQNIKVIRGYSTIFDNEAIRIVKSMPKWNPAVYEYRKRQQEVTIAINFDTNKRIEYSKNK